MRRITVHSRANTPITLLYSFRFGRVFAFCLSYTQVVLSNIYYSFFVVAVLIESLFRTQFSSDSLVLIKILTVTKVLVNANPELITLIYVC